MQKAALALLATTLLIIGTTDADGFGGRLFGGRSSYYGSYYYGSYYPSYYSSAYYYPSYSYSGYYPSYYSSYYPSYYYSSAFYSPSVSYYVPSYYYAAPALACSSTIDIPVVQANVATPTPAPASTTEPPIKSKRVPEVNDNTKQQSTASYNYFASTTVAKQSTEQIRVGFWNLSDQDYQLNVDGQVHTLKRNKGVSLTLSRDFVWQLGQRDPVREIVPAGEASSEIVIRD